MTGPLSGLIVVEIAEGVAGPMTGRYLGDGGADVIKVELPDGDRARQWGAMHIDGTSAAFLWLNRNKRSLVVDSLDDVVIDELLCRAGALLVDDGLVDIDAIMERHRHLVVCCISGWGAKGPWAHRPSSELAAQLASEATTSLGRIGEEPVRIGTEHGGISAAVHACQGILAALLVADEQGGQRVDVSVVGSLIQMRSTIWGAKSNPDAWYGVHLETYTRPPEYGYSCSDGHIYLHVGRVGDFDKLIDMLDMDFARSDPRWDTFRADIAGFTSRHGPALHDIWDRGLRQWTMAEAVSIIRENGGWAYPVNDYATFVASEQAQHLDLFPKSTTATGSPYHELRPPWTFSETPASIRRPAPLLGQHSAEIRAELSGLG